MTTPDIIILACLIIASIVGLFKGFVSQAIAVISIFAGAWLSFRFSQTLCDWAANYLTGVSEEILNITAFIIIFIISVFILSLLGRLLKKVVSLALLGWLDRLLGAVLALFSALMIIGILAILFSGLNGIFGIVDDNVLSNSPLFNCVINFADCAFPYLKALIFKQ